MSGATGGATIRVLVVDDQALVRQGVRAFLEALPDVDVVAEAGSGEEAVRLAAELVPDVVLMDLRMPGMDGVEATRRLVRASPRSRVVVLTSHHDDEHVFPALRAGALSYLLKDLSPEELADAVRRAVAGEATLHPRVAARVVDEIRGPGRHDPNPFADLTDREFEILRLVADGRSNAEIGETLGIGVRTVKGHVSNILSKLQIADRTQAAVLAWKRGVARRDEP